VVWSLALLINGLPAMETQVVVLLASLAVGANVYLMSRQFKTLEGPVASSLVSSLCRLALAALSTPLLMTLTGVRLRGCEFFVFGPVGRRSPGRAPTGQNMPY
jgi:malonate transporter